MRSGSSIDISAFPDRYFRNDERCVFFLRPNDRVSKWSGRKIWDIVKGVPVKDAGEQGLQRRPAGQSGDLDNLSATLAADRAFPAAVADLGRWGIKASSHV